MIVPSMTGGSTNLGHPVTILLFEILPPAHTPSSLLLNPRIYQKIEAKLVLADIDAGLRAASPFSSLYSLYPFNSRA